MRGIPTVEVRTLLRKGLSPSDLALAITVGVILGCLPIWGISTLLCVGVAVGLRLNLLAIQAANWFAMPLQFLLLFPFLRMGRWIFGHSAFGHSASFTLPWSRGILHLLPQVTLMLSYALVAWMLVAVPSALILLSILTMVLLRMAASRTSGLNAGGTI